jgi:hypothetical protein
MFACEPVTDDKEMGNIATEADLDITVQSTTPGGNEIEMINNSRGIASFWNWGVDSSPRQNVKTVLPFLGDIEVTFTGISAGGIMQPVTRTVSITTIDHPVDPTWALIAGDDPAGKVWTWDTEVAEVYGPGGFGNDKAPAWGGSALGTEQNGILLSPDDEIVFNLDGGANVINRTAGATETAGSFKFDMSKKRETGDAKDPYWSIGELTITGTQMLAGVDYYGGSTVVSTFDILALDEDTMILAYAAPGTPWMAWETCSFWMLKAK